MTIKLIKIIGVYVAVTFLTGCTGQIFSDDSIFAPLPGGMGKPAENAPPAYKQGWDDGCKTGLSTMNPGYYKSFYQYKQDASMVDDPVYYKAWKDSYTYCRQYSFKFVWDAYDKTRNSGPLSLKKLCVLCPDQFR